MKFTAAILATAAYGLKTRDDWCDWEWEECSQMDWRWPCDDEETPTDCGYWYWDDWNWEEFWVTCDEFSTWEECNGGTDWIDDGTAECAY